jgi:hypothetical protein
MMNILCHRKAAKPLKQSQLIIIILLAASCAWAQDKKEEPQPVKSGPANITRSVVAQKDKIFQPKQIQAGLLKRALPVNLGKHSQVLPQPQPQPATEIPLVTINKQQLERIRMYAIQPRPKTLQEAAGMGWKVHEILQGEQIRPVEDLIKEVPNEIEKIRRKAKELE